MSSEIIYELYHGTDLAIAKKIMKEGFIQRKNPEHWLGNGIYFYKDRSLAEWWTSKPSMKFGNPISVPALVCVTVGLQENHFFDLNNLTHYIVCATEYDKFHSIAKKRIEPAEEEYNINKIRCAFFDSLKERYMLDCVIGTFHLEDQRYLLGVNNASMKHAKLPYIETQICVFSETIIKKIAILELGR